MPDRTTPNPTAEIRALIAPILARIDPNKVATHGPDCYQWHVECLVLAVQRRLHEGTPSEEQIERAAKALYDTEPIRYTLSIHYEKVGEPKPWDALNEATKGVYRRKAIKVLTAAGIAPQEPSECSNPRCPLQRAHSGPCAPEGWSHDREKLIRNALEKVREIGEAGQAGEPLHDIPKDVDSNWGWLQRQWPVVVAIDMALAVQTVLDPEKVAEVLNRHEPIFKDGQYAGRCICGFEHPSYSGWRLHRARALCEAYTEGKLT